jgi:hypothetical protein
MGMVKDGASWVTEWRCLGEEPGALEERARFIVVR